MSHHPREDALAGGLAGGALGHEQGKGHTGRDAVIGAVGGDELGKHGNKRQAEGNVPVSQKVEGKVEELVGKVTSNPTKVAEGQARQGGVTNTAGAGMGTGMGTGASTTGTMDPTLQGGAGGAGGAY